MPSALSNKFFSLRQYVKHFFLAKRSGHGIHSPFTYQLCEELFYNPSEFYEFEELQNLRLELLKDKTLLQVTDLGAGSRHFKSKARRVGEIARVGISSDKKSRLLFRLINHFNCGISLELGSSLGLNALYMGLANKKGHVYSLEGDPLLAAFAKEFTSRHGPGNIHILQGEFEQLLPDLLKQLKQTDLVFLDGNHRYHSTLNYFHQVLPYCHSESILVVDDIYWSEEMYKAWRAIEKHPEVKLSLDLYHFGIVFFRKEILHKSDHRLWF